MSDRINLHSRLSQGAQGAGDRSLLDDLQGLLKNKPGSVLSADLVDGKVVLYAADAAAAKLDPKNKNLPNAWQRQQLAAIALYEAVSAAHGHEVADKVMNSLRRHLLAEDTFATSSLLNVAMDRAERAKNNEELTPYVPPTSTVAVPVGKVDDDDEEDDKVEPQIVRQKPDLEVRSGGRQRRDAVSSLAEATLVPQTEPDDDDDDEIDVLMVNPDMRQTPLPRPLDEMDEDDTNEVKNLVNDVGNEVDERKAERKRSLSQPESEVAAKSKPADDLVRRSDLSKPVDLVNSGGPEHPRTIYRSKHPKADKVLAGMNQLAELRGKAGRRARRARLENTKLRNQYRRWQVSHRSPSKKLGEINANAGKRFLERNTKSFKTWVEDAWMLNGKTSKEAERLCQKLPDTESRTARKAIEDAFRSLPMSILSLNDGQLHQVATETLRVHFGGLPDTNSEADFD